MSVGTAIFPTRGSAGTYFEINSNVAKVGKYLISAYGETPLKIPIEIKLIQAVKQESLKKLKQESAKITKNTNP